MESMKTYLLFFSLTHALQSSVEQLQRSQRILYTSERLAFHPVWYAMGLCLRIWLWLALGTLK